MYVDGVTKEFNRWKSQDNVDIFLDDDIDEVL
jgi:hypothetical protein